METDLNKYIKRDHIKAVETFNEELLAFAKETGENPPTLYEDPYTSFTLSDVRVENGDLLYNYDGKPETDRIVRYDDETDEFYESEYEGIMGTLSFWRKCLKRAKRYWSMDSDKLDAIQDGEAEDEDDDED